MTRTSTLFSKGAAIAALIGVSLLVAPAAHAQTSTTMMSAAQLQAEIASLQAQLASVQGHVNDSANPSTMGGSTLFNPFSSDASNMGVGHLLRSLAIGATGSDVSSLQAGLISHGFPIPAGVSGYFGAQTQSAVKAFQAASGISSTGYVGPLTIAKFNGLGGGVIMKVSPTTLGAGCTAGALFSSTTGQRCASPVPGTNTSFSSTDSLDSQMATIAGLQSGLNNDLSQSSTDPSQDDPSQQQ